MQIKLTGDTLWGCGWCSNRWGLGREKQEINQVRFLIDFQLIAKQRDAALYNWNLRLLNRYAAAPTSRG